jgi:Carbamoyltransferase C-terminus
MVAVHGPGPVESQLFVWHRRCSIRHNLKVKYREGFRPFAPSVLREVVSEWFELEGDSSYMLIVADVRKDRRRAITIEEAGTFRHREAQRCAFGNSGGDARRLFGPHSNRARQHQSTVPPPAQMLQRADWMPRAWTTPASMCAVSRSCVRRRCISLFYGQRARFARDRQLYGSKI